MRQMSSIQWQGAVRTRIVWLGFAISSCSGEIRAEQGASVEPPPVRAAPSTPNAADASVGAAAADADQPTPSAADGCDPAAPDPGPNPLRRLTRTQYLNSVHDLLGEVGGLEAKLSESAEVSEFGLIQPDVAPAELEDYQAAAELVAAAAVSTPAKLSKLVPCPASMQPRTCAQAFVRSFAARAYRAPLAGAEDLARHLALYDLGAQTDHTHGIELVLRAILQAPRFLYRVELGTQRSVGDMAIALSDYELAARLSYVFWDSLPDAALVEAADGGKLQTAQGLRTALTRVLAAPRGAGAMKRFLVAWLHLAKLPGLVKDPRHFPEWNGAQLSRVLLDQAQAFLDDVLGPQGGSLTALLTSRTVFANAALSPYYGTRDGASLAPIEVDDIPSAGVLTLPAFLAVTAKPAESSPIYRGKFVREALLCQTLPAPPPNVPKLPDVQEGVSTRQRLSQHETDPVCSGCHRLMDPIGFGFENFDAIGRFRASDGAEPIDSHGELIGTRSLDGVFSGVEELADDLAGSAEVHECMVRQWFRFALARYEREVDACALTRMQAEFSAQGASLLALPAATVASDAFRYRRPIDREELP
jgi:hypothetical protein